MKKRYVYAFLFGVPGFFLSLIVSFLVFGATAGALWLYVFGDDPWPPFAERILPALFFLAFLALWIVVIVAGLRAGKALEQQPGLNRNHVMVSVAATLAPIALLVLHQFGVGNIGPKPVGILCSELCTAKGFVASGTPPAGSGEVTCSCFDERGQEIIKLPLEGQ